MKFMVIVPATQASESGQVSASDQATLEAMGNFNEELVKAGVILAGEGLLPTSRGSRITFGKGGKSSVKDGPFTESKELIAGFWILQTRTKEECLEWMSRAPFPEGTTLEIRQIAEVEDFAAADPDGRIREQEERLRREVEKQQQG